MSHLPNPFPTALSFSIFLSESDLKNSSFYIGSMCWKCASAVGEEGWFQMIQSEARSKEDHWQWANHRGWRCKWGWEMGNACPSMTQIATVCLAEKWQRVPTTGLGYMPVWSGNSKWEPGADILTRGGDKKWNLGLGGGRGGERGWDSKSVKALIRSVHRPSLIPLLVY